MKKLIIAGLVLCAVVSAYADTMEIYWRTWAFDHTASDLTIDTEDDSTGILNNFDVLWQLIRTESGTPALPDLSDPNYLGSGDTLLTDARYLSGSNHGSWNLALYWDEDARSAIDVGDKTTVNSFYIYQRVYELAPGTTAPVEGTY